MASSSGQGIGYQLRRIRRIVSGRPDIKNLLLSQLVPLMCNMLMVFGSAALLGPTGRGDLALIVATGSLLGIAAFGSAHVGVVHAFRLGDSSAIWRGFAFVLLAGAVIVVVGVTIVLASPGLAFGSFTNRLVLPSVIGGGVVAVNLYLLRTVQGLGESKAFRNAWLIQSAGFLLLGLTAAGLGASAPAVAYCWIIAVSVSTCSVFGRLRHLAAARKERRVSSSSLFQMAASAHVGLFGQQIMNRADVLIIGVVSTSADVGVYSIAAAAASLLWTVTEALSLAAFSQRDTVGRTDARTHRTRLIRANLMVGVPGAVAVALGSLAVPIVLPGFDGVPMLVWILLPGVLIQGYARIGLASILTLGMKRASVAVGLGSAILSMIYLPFVVTWGATGAAIASTLIAVLQSVLVWAVLRRPTASR